MQNYRNSIVNSQQRAKRNRKTECNSLTIKLNDKIAQWVLEMCIFLETSYSICRQVDSTY